MRRLLLAVVGAVRVAAKSGPSEGSRSESNTDLTYAGTKGHEGSANEQSSQSGSLLSSSGSSSGNVPSPIRPD